MTDQLKNKLDRREFLGAAAAASFMIIKPQLVRGTDANSQLRFGILGCGGRATAEGSSFVENAGRRVTAIADLFADQLEKGRQHFDGIQQAKGYAPIDSSQLFKGPNAYQEIANSKEVDFILITTPPYFHQHHLETIVARRQARLLRKAGRGGRSGSTSRHQHRREGAGQAELGGGIPDLQCPAHGGADAATFTTARWGRSLPGSPTIIAAISTGRIGRTPHPKKSGCATGCGIASSPATSSWSKTFTLSTCATGC